MNGDGERDVKLYWVHNPRTKWTDYYITDGNDYIFMRTVPDESKEVNKRLQGDA